MLAWSDAARRNPSIEPLVSGALTGRWKSLAGPSGCRFNSSPYHPNSVSIRAHAPTNKAPNGGRPNYQPSGVSPGKPSPQTRPEPWKRRLNLCDSAPHPIRLPGTRATQPFPRAPEPYGGPLRPPVSRPPQPHSANTGARHQPRKLSRHPHRFGLAAQRRPDVSPGCRAKPKPRVPSSKVLEALKGALDYP